MATMPTTRRSTEEDSTTTTTTSFLLSNLHCPSCVSHIQDTLFALVPPPTTVSPSLLSSWVTVTHERALPVPTIQDALEREGFDISTVVPAVTSTSSESYPTVADGEIGYLDRFLSRFSPRRADDARLHSKEQNEKHVDNCDACRDVLRKSSGHSAVVESVASSTSSSSPSPTALPLVVVDDPEKEDLWRAELAIGGMTCASCANAVTEKLEMIPWVRKVAVNLIANSATVEFVGGEHKDEIAGVIDDAGYDATLDSVREVKKKEEDLWRAQLAIGGMTCAACVGAITKELGKKSWVRKVVVNLISNSATVDFVGEDHKNDVIGSIEDIGYEAALDTVSRVQKTKQERRGENVERTVEILVDGMYCNHCPGRLLSGLEAFGDELKIAEDFGQQNPILKVTYTPKVPRFTIRHILEAISAIEPSFKPSIYHPPTLEERSRYIHKREQFRLLFRVILTLVIGIPTLVIGIIYMSLVSHHNPGRMFLMHPLVAGVSRAQWALFILATPVYFLCADVFHIRALKELRSMWRRGSTTPILHRFYRFGSMNMLMSLGTSIAYISSLAQLVAAGVHPSLEPADSSFYFDSVVFLTFFLLIGRLIESYSKSKTGDAVAMLGKLRPTTALLVTTSDHVTGEQLADGGNTESVQTINVDLLEMGDVVKVLNGGSPPCDGVVIKGESRFDESSLTGESRLVKKSIDDEVFSGTINKESPVAVRIIGVSGGSMLDQIVKAVREGQTRRAPMERVADTLTAYFVPFVTMIAILDWIIWLSLGLSGVLPESYLEGKTSGWVAWSLQFAIAVFVVACPCGLALAAPTALFVGGGLAAKHGILAKGGGEAFEKASKLDCVVFDKTGTLTVGGEPVVTDHQLFDVQTSSDEEKALDRSLILGMIKALEESSSHTVAKAIVTLCKSLDTRHITPEHVDEIPGKGMKATFQLPDHYEPTTLIVGNELLLSDLSARVPEHVQVSLEQWKSEGKSVALAAISLPSSSPQKYALAAIFSISDPIRPEAPVIIRALRARNTDIWMLSGDNAVTARAVGAKLGIPASNVIAGVLPSQKADKIRFLQRTLKARTLSGDDHATQRALVAMVGDGINDSPALTTADVGIAIGSGSDIAISSAEFVLVSSNLRALVTLLDLSRVVFRRIKFNFAWALVYNMVALPVAAGVLYPLTVGADGSRHVRLDPVWASLAMAASSISVVCSSLALRSKVWGVGFRASREGELGDGSDD